MNKPEEPEEPEKPKQPYLMITNYEEPFMIFDRICMTVEEVLKFNTQVAEKFLAYEPEENVKTSYIG